MARSALSKETRGLTPASASNACTSALWPKPGGVVAACVWDHARDGGPLAAFWRAVKQGDPDAPGESRLAGAREGHLVELCQEAGLSDIDAGRLSVEVGYSTFDEWWLPFTLGVGPAGGYVVGLDDGQREELRIRCVEQLPPAPFEISASAWTAFFSSSSAISRASSFSRRSTSPASAPDGLSVIASIRRASSPVAELYQSMAITRSSASAPWRWAPR